MKNSLISVFGWLLILLAGGCVDPYRPAEITAPDTYLVVNGYFDSVPGATTTIKLSRTQNLTDSKKPTPEIQAQVTIESAHGASYNLEEAGAGIYSFSGVTPLSDETYRLHIRTANGSDYYSDYVPVITTPPIDSISWRTEEEKISIRVNTHDPQNKTHYYRWEYDETWAYTAGYYSSLILANNELVSRDEDIYHCWGSASSKNILINSTTRLSRDVVSQFPLATFDYRSIRFQSKYSILVRQFALSQEGYDYYDQLAKITQNIGSIFDPQPSQITGNYHASKSSDLVLGFFRVGTVATKRIFINKLQLPPVRTITGDEQCVVDTLTLSEIRDIKPEVITMYDRSSYLTTNTPCVDCRLKGGVTQRPDFWE